MTSSATRPSRPAAAFPAPRAAYVFDRTLSAASRADRLLLFHRLAATGLDCLVTKAASVTDALAAEARGAGLRVLGSVACFSDHAESAAERGKGVRPVGADGRPWEPVEWYTGLVPTDGDRLDRLTERCRELAAGGRLDGIVLDFLRWPLHWELELRPGATPRDGSYDPATLGKFARRTGIDVPTGPAAAAAMLRERHREEWLGFRRSVISEAAERLTATVRRTRPGMWTGLFLVPEADTGKREALLGQSVADLAPLFDALLVMTYHSILRREPGWIAEVTRAVRTEAGRAPWAGRTAVVPMVQTTSSPALARGADWGDEATDEGFRAALGYALGGGDGGLCLFPGEGLGARRRALVADALRADA